MQYSKRDVSRAISEIDESMVNILNADYKTYVVRLRQLFLLIKNNPILSLIIDPYLQLELDEDNTGFIDEGNSGSVSFIIPNNEDEEISLILKVLLEMTKDDDSAINLPVSLYYQTAFADNLSMFNENIIKPALIKLERKLKYKAEDLDQIPGNEVDTSQVTIINIDTISATNSMIAVGKNINQNQSSNVFDNIKKEIDQKIDDLNLKTELFELIKEMEINKNSYSFQEKYNSFITKLGTYITIISPFLPQLVAFFGN